MLTQSSWFFAVFSGTGAGKQNVHIDKDARRLFGPQRTQRLNVCQAARNRILSNNFKKTEHLRERVRSLPGNPYDGHTLGKQLEQVRRVLPVRVAEVHVDIGYRGHGYKGEETIHVDKRRRGNTVKTLWKKMKRRAAVEPTIGHCKSEHRMERNRLDVFASRRSFPACHAAVTALWSF